MSSQIRRRDFVKQSIATGASITLAGHQVGARILGANDRIRAGFIGLGRQGRSNLKGFIGQPEVQVVALCDVYGAQLTQTLAETKLEVATYKDFRQVLDRKDIDVVVISTPDHWHALPTVAACQAGKDVYVEKPISVTIDEGRKMVQAARKYNRIVQVGTQQRSGLHYQRAVEIVRSGRLGKITFVRTWNYGNSSPEGIGHPPDGEPPADLDWDLWLGPAPKVPFNPNRFGVYPDRWSSFRWFWDYAGGMLTDWGVHHLDIVHMVMGVDAPLAAAAAGGKYALRDNRETPDTLLVTYEYPGFICTYENREVNAQASNGQGYGISFHGTEGTLFINRDGFEVIPEIRRMENKPVPRTEASREKGSNNQHLAHVRNFLDAVKSRQAPIAEIEIGHRSTSAALFGNIALRAGRRIAWNAKTERIEGDPSAARYLTREYRKPWKLVV
jgi:predicted dehydrogenase